MPSCSWCAAARTCSRCAPRVRPCASCSRCSDGGATGILPDQQPKAGDGVFVPFFGVQALTMTLVNRLAERTGATVLYGWCERIGPGMQFALHIEPTDPAVADRTRRWRHRAQRRHRAHRPPRPGAVPVDLQALYVAALGSGEEDPYATEEHPH